MTIWIYVIVIVLFIVFYIVTSGYRKSEISKLDKKENQLHYVYGMAMFLADGPLKGIVSKNGRNIENKFKGLYVKEKVELEKYLYVVSKLALAIVVIFVACVFGLFSELSADNNKEKVKFLERNEYGEGESVYDLKVDIDGEYESFEVIVSEKELTEEEAATLLEGKRGELLKEVLGENKSPDKITKPLSLVSSIGDEEVQVIWEVENEEVINYDGTLGREISKDGELTKLYATLSLGDVSVRHELIFNVFPQEFDDAGQAVQNIIDDSEPSKKEINLPSKIGDKKVNFYPATDNVSMYFLPIGIIAAIMIFVLKDKDIETDVKERNRQLIMDYPEVVSKIMLLNMAGMSMRRAWEMTIQSSKDKGNHYVYQEMRLSNAKMNGGISEVRAYEEFGKRCGLHCYIRFTNIISQNLKRGSSELCKMLSVELGEAMQEQKNNALKIGEEAGTKLLAPMVIMLIVGMVIIVVPAFMSMKI